MRILNCMNTVTDNHARSLTLISHFAQFFPAQLYTYYKSPSITNVLSLVQQRLARLFKTGLLFVFSSGKMTFQVKTRIYLSTWVVSKALF